MTANLKENQKLKFCHYIGLATFTSVIWGCIFFISLFISISFSPQDSDTPCKASDFHEFFPMSCMTDTNQKPQIKANSSGTFLHSGSQVSPTFLWFLFNLLVIREWKSIAAPESLGSCLDASLPYQAMTLLAAYAHKGT